MSSRQTRKPKAKPAKVNANKPKPKPPASNGGKREMYNPGLQRTIAAPVSYGTLVRTGRPNSKTTGTSRNIQFRELVLSAVAGSTTFTIQSTLALNPGVAATFPRLAAEAQLWQQYRFNSLRFEWVPFAATSTAGDIMLSPNYDASQPPPVNETQASDNYGACISSVYAPFTCVLDPAAMMGSGPRRWIRSTNIAGDIKTFDVGKLFVISNNESGTSTVGKLYVEYDVDLFLPQNTPADSSNSQQTSFYSRATAQTFTTTVASNLDFDAAQFDPLGFGADVAGVYTPAAGCYRISTVVAFNDSANEEYIVTYQYLKNSSALASPIIAFHRASGAGASGSRCTIPLAGVISFNGSDTFAISVTMTGAAGTLTSLATSPQLVVSLA